MPRRKYHWRVPKAKREEILQTAIRERLSGAEVAKRFGISAHTYYSWRSPARGIHVKSKREAAARANGHGDGDLRSEVRAHVQRVLPAVVKEEVDHYLAELLGRRRPGRPRTRV